MRIWRFFRRLSSCRLLNVCDNICTVYRPLHFACTRRQNTKPSAWTHWRNTLFLARPSRALNSFGMNSPSPRLQPSPHMHSPRNALSPRHVPNAIAELAAAKLQFQNLPVHKRHTTSSAQSYKGDSPQHVLTPSSPRERALERSRLRFEKQARVPFREEESERDRTSRTQVLALTPYLDDAKAQRPEIIAMSNSLAVHHEQLKDKLHTRFKSMGRAFRLMDVDKSNSCDVKEVREGLTRMFNLEHIPDAQMNRLAELMDTSGDGTVRLDEFARFFSTDHRPSSAVDLHRENALRRATRPASSPTRGRFGSPSKSPTKVRFS